MSKIGKSENRRLTRSSKNEEIDSVDQDEIDFNKCSSQWHQEMHASYDLDDTDEIDLNDSIASQSKKIKLSEHSIDNYIPSSPISIGEDDPEYWEG